MNNITIINSVAIANPEVKKGIAKIARLAEMTNKNTFEIAISLATLSHENYDNEEEIKNFTDLAKKVFGLSKSTAYDLVNVAERFTSMDFKNFSIRLPKRINEWVISKLYLLLPLTDAQIDDMFEKEVINSDMSVRDLKKAIEDYLTPVVESDAVEIEPEATETEESNDMLNEEPEDFTVTFHVPYKVEGDLYNEIQNLILDYLNK